METDTLASATWQPRPLFISSTFKDMQSERDYLRQFVFPQLEEELRAARIVLEPIDLRLGVETLDLDTEEKRELLVLKVCLEEIQRSRPFLIVLLGDRYGWVPPEERMAAAVQEAGFVTDVAGKSVTALEIEFGILHANEQSIPRSFFYFRDPLPYEQMPADVAAVFSDQYSDDPAVRDRHRHLITLKQSLAADPRLASRVHRYQGHWDSSTGAVTGLEDFGTMVAQHLKDEMQEEIDAVAQRSLQTWQDLERTALAEFLTHRRRDFTGRQQLLEGLRGICLSEATLGIPFATAGSTWGACVTGEPGSGKSAILAELAEQLSADPSVLLLINAAGATPRGSDIDSMLSRFVQELSDAISVANPLREDASPEEIDTAFSGQLSRVAATRRIVLLMDALDQFRPTTRALHLTWLRPRQWPANARLIATGQCGISADALSQWAGIEELEIPPLSILPDDTDDVSAIAKSIWQRYHRQVNLPILQVLKAKHTIDGAFAAGNPLWLTLALEQLNLMDGDDFARADRQFAGSPAERLRAMLIDAVETMPPTVEELYDLLLAQTERIFGIATCQAFVTLIGVSRFGWRETDLLAMIPSAARVLFPDEPLPVCDVLRLAMLRRSFRAHLVRRGQLEQLNFFHGQMFQAVSQRVLKNSHTVPLIHRVVCDHLESLASDDPLRESELMPHLIEADDPSRAAIAFAEMQDGSAALASAVMAIAQQMLTEDTEVRSIQTAWIISLLDQTNLNTRQRKTLADRFVQIYDAVAPMANIETSGSLLQAADEAMQQLLTADPSNRELLRNRSVSLERLADQARLQGNLSEARQFYSEGLRIRQQVASNDPGDHEWQFGLAMAFGKLGDVTAAEGDTDAATLLWNDCLDIVRRLTGTVPVSSQRQHFLSVTLERLANLAIGRSRLDDAEQFSSESLAIKSQLHRSDPTNVEWELNLANSLEQRAEIASLRGDLPETQSGLNAAFQIRQKLVEAYPAVISWQFNLAVSLIKLGDFALDQGNAFDAERSYSDSYRILRRLTESESMNEAWQSSLSVVLERLGDIAASQGNLPEARRLYEDSLHVCQQWARLDPTNFIWKRDLSKSHMRLGDLEMAAGNLHAAQDQFIHAAHIGQRVADSDESNATWQRDVVVSLSKVGDIASVLRDMQTADSAFRRGLEINQRLADSDPTNVVWQRDLSVSFFKLAHLARDCGDAAGYFRELRNCYHVLVSMQQRDLHFDSQMTELYTQLIEQFGKDG